MREIKNVKDKIFSDDQKAAEYPISENFILSRINCICISNNEE